MFSENPEDPLGCILNVLSFLILIGSVYILNFWAENLNHKYWKNQFQENTIEAVVDFKSIEQTRFFLFTERFLIVEMKLEGETIENGILFRYLRDDNELFLMTLYTNDESCKEVKIVYSESNPSIFKIIGCK